MMTSDSGSTSDKMRLLEEAYAAAKRALELLDQASAPARIGAHIDNGLSELETLITSLERKCA